MKSNLLINHLTSGEENLMKILWTQSVFYLKDILEAYPEPKPHPNTISTFLKNLVEKKFLKPEKEGRIFKYITCINYDDYKFFLIKNLIQEHFSQTSDSFEDFLLKKEFLSYQKEISLENSTEKKPKEKKKKKKKKKKKDEI